MYLAPFRLLCSVLANILQGPLLELAPRLGSYAKQGALLALSGILGSQTPAVIEEYRAQGFGDFKFETDGDWALLTASKIN
jgi:ribosomal protein L11 methyltransferase